MKAGAVSKKHRVLEDFPPHVADVLRAHLEAHIKASANAERLRIPSWVPPAIADCARTEWEAVHNSSLNGQLLAELHPPTPQSLERLVCDLRMRSVWRELSRRHRNGAFLHPAEQQDVAMVELFLAAWLCVLRPQITRTRRPAEQRHREVTKRADELRVEGFVLLSRAVKRDGADAKNIERYDRIVAAADALKEYADETLTIELRTARDRGHGEGKARWFALAVTKKCRALFGAPLYGVSATITSVALNRSVKPRTVRQWYARHPADKTPKNQPLPADY